MATYDRRLESQDQPVTGKPINHDHPYYGPDPYAMKQPIRDQPDPGRAGFWSRLLTRISQYYG